MLKDNAENDGQNNAKENPEDNAEDNLIDKPMDSSKANSFIQTTDTKPKELHQCTSLRKTALRQF